MARILRAPLARNDLLDIWSYIASESSPSVADGFLAKIYGALEVVASAPYAGRERAEFDGRPRSVAVYPYVIFYEALPEGDGIGIWRVLHGARRMEDLLRKPGRFE